MIQQAGPKSTILSLYNILSVVCDSPVPSKVVTAEVITDADVIRLSLDSFKKLNEQYPASVNQLIQVAVTRFQRVSFLTLNKYFGLTTELLKTEHAEFPQSPTWSRNLGDMEETELSQVVVNKICEVTGVEASTGLLGFIKYESFEEGELLVEKGQSSAGIIVVVEGQLEVSMHDLSRKKKMLEVVEAGGLAGHWTFITGCQSLLEVKAKTSCKVATLTKESFDVVMERNPGLWVNVARKMLSQLSTLIRQVDFALEWVHITAGQILYSQGDESDDIYFVLHGRLRSHVKTSTGDVQL